jgi:Tol biopolymer transport system component
MDALVQLNTALAGRYELEREIGRGGMATVFLARDLRHQRQVALKLLDPELGAVLGADRFLSEIRVTANLQHPNLLPLFDSGEVDGLLFYVMPYVAGESLRARLDREKQLPVGDAVHVATAVASALDYAHRQGVVHRDLKPENILLHDGEPVVADFGIALAVSKAGGARVTATGISLGTPQYMSPEQATGDRAIDGRADIYALGAVAYEMLAGEAPHAASTAQATIARLLTEEPRPLSAVRRAVPAHVEAAVLHALAKLPADRFTTAHEFADALQGKGGVGLIAPTSKPRSRRPLAIAYGVATLSAVAAVWAWARPTQAPELATVRFKVDLPAGQQFDEGSGVPVAISPNGRTIAYRARAPQRPPSIFVRHLDELQAHVVPGTENAVHPAFSRDGAWISFRGEDDRLNKVPVGGGAPSLIALVPKWHGDGWGANNEVVYASSNSILRLRTAGEAPTIIASLDKTKDEFSLFGPVVMPDGDHVLFGILSATSPTPTRLGIVSLADRSHGAFELAGASPIGYVDGWLIHGRPDQSIAAIRFDPRAGRTTGTAITLIDDAFWKDAGGSAASLSTSGSLIYVRGETDSFLRLLDTRGSLAATIGQAGSFSAPAWSPDGKRIAVEVRTATSAIAKGIWILDVASGVFSRITSSVSAESPSWTADGRRIAFINASDPKGPSVWSVPADNSGSEEPFFALPGKSLGEITFSADGHYAVVRTNPTIRSDTAWKLWLVPLEGDRTAVPFSQMSFDAGTAAISPNSKWVAFESDANGGVEIFVRAISGPAGIVQVSSGDGQQPCWMPDGRLVYRGGHAFRAATIASVDGAPAVARRDSLFADIYRLNRGANRPSYDISRDGRFVVSDALEGREIVVVENWLTEVRAKLKGK